MVLLLGCDESHNPVDSIPEGTATVVHGNILDTARMDGIPLILRGENRDFHAITYGDGMPDVPTKGDGDYSLTDVPFGKYTIIPGDDEHRFYPENIEITVASDEVQIPVFIGYTPPQNERLIIGYLKGLNGIGFGINENTERNPYSVTGIYRSINGLSAYAEYISDESITELTMKFTLYSGEPFAPFQPDSVVIKLDDTVIFQDVEFTFEDWPRHTVSGYVSSKCDVDGIPVTLWTLNKQNNIIQVQTYKDSVSSDGSFIFSGVLRGEYSLEFEDGIFVISGDAGENISINNDVELPVYTLRYHGPTTITLHGRVIDQDGNPIPGVTISRLNEIGITAQQVLTDSDGRYEMPYTINPGKSVTLRLQASKSTIELEDDIRTIPVVWEIDEKERDIEVPDFVGIDYSALSAEEFFPLNTISRWTYRRTSGDETTDVDVTVSAIGDGWYRFTPRGPADFQEFRLMGNNVDVRDTNGMVGTLLKWGVSPGTSWKVFPDQQYQVWNGKFIGFEEVTVPAGTYECAVFEAGIAWDSQSDTVYTLWFARDIGLVKMSRISRSNGVVLESRIDELVGIGNN